jgi:hypothetical protein
MSVHFGFSPFCWLAYSISFCVPASDATSVEFASDSRSCSIVFVDSGFVHVLELFRSVVLFEIISSVCRHSVEHELVQSFAKLFGFLSDLQIQGYTLVPGSPPTWVKGCRGIIHKELYGSSVLESDLGRFVAALTLKDRMNDPIRSVRHFI